MKVPNCTFVRYAFPEPDQPFYHVRLRIDAPESDLSIAQVRANGSRVRDYAILEPGANTPRPLVKSGQTSDIVIRLDWQANSHDHIEVDFAQGADVQTISLESDAPGWGGYWDDRWGYYASVVLSETAGLPRKAEPVHLLLNVYASRMQNPAREVRVVAIEPLSGSCIEVPAQVSGVSLWDLREDEHCQPTVTFEVAFFASVAAHARCVYLVFYGNPEAEAPVHVSDLVVQGEGCGLTVENDFYRIQLHPKSGVIEEILLKQGVNVTFDHHLETNGALHWNPDVYAPPRTWIHTSDWDPPAGHSEEAGPLFLAVKRWGPMPEYPEVECSISYTFYAGTPYVEVSTTIDVSKAIDVQALRNGEIVLNRNVVREFAYKQMDGGIETVVIKDRPRHPTRGLDLPAKTPWWAFFNRDIPCALAVLNLELTHVQREGGRALWEPFVYLHWGPWVYCARPLVYTFATPNPQRVAHVPAGSGFYERMAFLPCRLGTSEADQFAVIEDAHQRLAHPLVMTAAVLDIDPRTPDEWTPPILVSEFEEIED